MTLAGQRALYEPVDYFSAKNRANFNNYLWVRAYFCPNFLFNFFAHKKSALQRALGLPGLKPGVMGATRLLPQQAEHTLGQLVGLGHHGRAGLLQHLGA